MTLTIYMALARGVQVEEFAATGATPQGTVSFAFDVAKLEPRDRKLIAENYGTTDDVAVTLNGEAYPPISREEALAAWRTQLVAMRDWVRSKGPAWLQELANVNFPRWQDTARDEFDIWAATLLGGRWPDEEEALDESRPTEETARMFERTGQEATRNGLFLARFRWTEAGLLVAVRRPDGSLSDWIIIPGAPE